MANRSPGIQSIQNGVINKCQKGNIKDFEKLFDLYGDKILNYIHNYIREDIETAKDLMQETFVSVYKGINKLQDADKFQNWIFTIASNKCRDYLRKQKNFPIVVNSELINEVVDNSSNPATVSNDGIDMELINEIVSQMPFNLREIFIMRKFNNMKFQDISMTLKCSLRTVKYRMKKALTMFSKELQKKGFNFES